MAWKGFSSSGFVMRNPSDDYIKNANTDQAKALRLRDAADKGVPISPDTLKKADKTISKANNAINNYNFFDFQYFF